MAYDTVPDNLEFNIPVVNTEVTLHFQNNTALTSSDDTTTDKYTDTNRTRNRYVVGADNAIVITKINGQTLTDPRTIPANLTFAESEVPGMVSITIRNEVANTNVHCFMR